jgi:hypothetical protein
MRIFDLDQKYFLQFLGKRLNFFIELVNDITGCLEFIFEPTHAARQWVYSDVAVDAPFREHFGNRFEMVVEPVCAARTRIKNLLRQASRDCQPSFGRVGLDLNSRVIFLKIRAAVGFDHFCQQPVPSLAYTMKVGVWPVLHCERQSVIQPMYNNPRRYRNAIFSLIFDQDEIQAVSGRIHLHSINVAELSRRHVANLLLRGSRIGVMKHSWEGGSFERERKINQMNMEWNWGCDEDISNLILYLVTGETRPVDGRERT